LSSKGLSVGPLFAGGSPPAEEIGHFGMPSADSQEWSGYIIVTFSNYKVFVRRCTAQRRTFMRSSLSCDEIPF
jgi:hypothetical protein